MKMSNCTFEYILEPHRLEGRIISNSHVHTLSWSITFEEYNTIRQIETENVEYINNDDQFRLKFNFVDSKHDTIEIYHLYPKDVVIENAELILKARNSRKNIVKNRNCKLKGNKWYHMYSLKKITAFGNYSYNCLSLTFIFITQEIPVDDKSIVLPGPLLINDLEHLLSNSMYSDVIIKSAEGFEFKVHKGILSSRSTVLNACFVHDTLECKNNVVDSHFDTEVLKEVLTYIYTDRAPRVQEIPDKLLEAAEFYNLPGLKTACEESLHLKLTKDNAIKTLELADLHSATSLKQLTLEFIKDGHAGVVTKTDDWKNMKSLELIKTLYEFVTL